MGGGWRLGSVKLPYTKNPKSEFFIKNPNLTKTFLVVGSERGGGVARVSDFFSFFSKESKSEEKIVFFLRG